MELTEKKRLLFIINPYSGLKLGETIPEKLIEVLNTAKFSYETVFTEYPGHATEIASEAIVKGYYGVIAAGGDGTLNEVANALQGSHVIMGIIPVGSGNGFSHHLGIKHDIIEAIKTINEENLFRIDTGKANQRFFINVAGVGLDATIASKTQSNENRGFIPYFISTVKEIFGFKALKMKVSTPDKSWTGTYSTVVVANASIYGYNFTVAPEAVLNDGLFDILLLKKAPLWRQLLSLIPRVLNKTVHKSNLIEYFRSGDIQLEFYKPTYFHVDGEGFAIENKINFKIQEKNLTIFKPII